MESTYLGEQGAGATLCRIAGSSTVGARYFLRVHESGQRQLAVTAPVGEDQTRPTRRRTASRRLAAVLTVAALTIGLFLGYLFQSRNSGANSDAAAMALQGWELVHGHLLLRGWFLSDVSFYTFEVPLDGLISVVYGLQSDVIHVAAAAEYALLVLFAALVAAGAAWAQFALYRPTGLLLSLACLAPLVPLLDRLLPGATYRWPRPALLPPERSLA